MVRLAQKAFYPGPIPFPLLHVDTTYKFREMIEFRDRFCARDRRRPDRPHQPEGHRRGRQPVRARHPEMLRAAEDARAARRARRRRLRRGVRRRPPRRGEIARQGARLLLPRRASASGTRRTSGRSCGTSTTAASIKGESIRVFPLSNWTELDVWQYIHLENIPIVPLYFAEAAADGGARRHADPGGARHAAAARREAADGDVPHALARLHALHRRDPLATPTRCRRSSRR